MKGVMAFRNTIPVQYSGGACVSVVNVVILLVLKDIKSFTAVIQFSYQNSVQLSPFVQQPHYS